MVASNRISAKKKAKVSTTQTRAVTEKATTAKRLMKIFGHTPYATAKGTADNISYRPAVGELDPKLLMKHLKGDTILGSYALTSTNQVHWLGWDIDSNDLAIARDYTQRLVERIEHIPHAVEFSGGKGYHVLIFLEEPMSANRAKQIAEFVREIEGLPRSGTSQVECYPKQAKLTQANPLGNLLKIPLGRHPRTHAWSAFVDPLIGWETEGILNPLEILANKAHPDLVEQLLLGEKENAIQLMAQSLASVWSEGERHALALALSGYLVNIGWGLEQVKELMEKICHHANDPEGRNRLQAVTDTFKKFRSGNKVAGYLYLASTLPGRIMAVLMSEARKIATPPIMKKLEDVRLAKGAQFAKVRDSADAMWAHLNETGSMLRTSAGGLFWFGNEDKFLYNLTTESWLAIIHKIYGINPAEPFGRQMLRSIQLKALTDGVITDIHRKSYWSGEELFVNLGGKEVYILDGESIRVHFNGDCGVIFLTNPDPRSAPQPDFDTNVSAWKFLTNDLSFIKSKDASAAPKEQRELLRAWILSFFFPQLMETKPILCALGAPGAGKTSMMRRIVRILEGPREDVLAFAEDRHDAIRASVEQHKLLVLDNLEQTRAKWLVHVLNTLATGSIIELRTLFKTNEVYRIEPDVYVGITAVDIPFSESTLHSRLLPIELGAIENIIPENVLQRRLRQNQEIIWGSLLLMLSEVVKTLKKTQIIKAPIQSRLADFTVFCARIAGVDSKVINYNILHKGLLNLTERQRAQMLQTSPIIAVLEEYINDQPDNASKWHTYTELMHAINTIAHHRRLWLDRVTTASGLKRHLSPRMPALVRIYGARLREIDSSQGRKVEQIRFTEPLRIDFSVGRKTDKKRRKGNGR